MDQAINIQTVDHNSNKEKASSSLWHYFEKDFIDETITQYEQKVSTGLSNLDVALGGGISPQLYCLIGRMSDERNPFLSFMAEHLASNGYTVLYFTNHDTENTLLQQILARHDYKRYRDQSPYLPDIINKISSSHRTLQEYQASLYPILTTIQVETCTYIDAEVVEEKISSYKKMNSKVAILIDEQELPIQHSKIERISERIYLKNINKIAIQYEVPIIMNVTLAKGDFERITAGFRTTLEIETIVDNIILFTKPEPIHATLNPFVLKLVIRSKSSPYHSQMAHLTYHPTHFYFQDA